MTSFAGVVGAGGLTGGYVVRALAERGVHVRGLVRSTRSDEAAREAGADHTAQADLADRESLTTALAGLDTLVFIAPPFDAQEEQHAANALAAASAQHVRNFVYYSVLHASFPDVPHHQRKLNVETLVQDSGLSWTVIQPIMYQQNLLQSVRRTTDGVVRVPYSSAARFHLVDLADVAQVIARVVAEPADHAYASYELAGPQGLNTTEMAAEVAQALGITLRVEEIPLTALPLPPTVPRRQVAEMMAMFAKYDRSGYTGNANVLRYLLGREPVSLADTARRELTGK